VYRSSVTCFPTYVRATDVISSVISICELRVQEQRDLLRNMEVQKADLGQQVKLRRSELQKIKDEMDTSDEILQVNILTKIVALM